MRRDDDGYFQDDEPDGRMVHRYVSTYCQHNLCEQDEDVCRLFCKVCRAPCLCPCHPPARRLQEWTPQEWAALDRDLQELEVRDPQVAIAARLLREAQRRFLDQCDRAGRE